MKLKTKLFSTAPRGFGAKPLAASAIRGAVPARGLQKTSAPAATTAAIDNSSSARFSSAEIEELEEMLWKAAPQTLKTMSTGRTPLLATEDPEAQRDQIRRYFHATFDKTEQLFALFTDPAAYYIKHEPLRHPPIFYYGHTACFFVNKLILAQTISERINPTIEHMCAVGVDEMSWDDLNEAHYDWPSIEEVQEYRDEVRDMVDGLIATLPMDSLINWESSWWPILMGIEHENIHTETSSAIFRQAPLSMISLNSEGGEHWRMCLTDTPPPSNELLDVPESTVVWGKQTDSGRVYGWDNEYGEKTAVVPPFKASKYLVSNAEYKEFVDSGGYEDKRWWTEEGWAWLGHSEAKHPKFWVKGEDGQWQQRQLAALTNLPWSWPVIVNQLESKAFCEWKSHQSGESIRLPSEDEWRALRQLGPHGDVDQPDWDRAPGNINLEYFASECPVDVFEWGGTGFYDVIGNVWQWTETPIDGLPGFEVHPLYDDFSTPTFDGKHTVFKGGSWVSMGCNGATTDSRYAFRRHFFQHAGIRYVQSDTPVDTSMNLYETDPLVLREIDAHFPEAGGALPGGLQPFAKVSAQAVLDAATAHGLLAGRVLDLGCGTGRRSFELASALPNAEVTGVDRTARYIKAAVRLQEGEIVRYTVPSDGAINSFHEVSLSPLGLAEGAARCHFAQGQPENLDRKKLGCFDIVVGANLLETLQSPKDFLESIADFVKPGGLLVLSSTYDWQAELTSDGDPTSQRVGGYKCETSGENVSSVVGLGEVLKGSFVQREAPAAELVDVRRSTMRRMQYDLAEMTVWQRL